ncbi:MAG: glycosyltransferase family 4 protein [Armatimonadota bacterium]|nr:glycosyltransferase family 4 protein [Armatimonadota bacterium]
MHVLVASCVFPPEPMTSALTSEHLALGLLQRGHRVTVITGFPSHPEGRLYPGYRWRVWQSETTPAGYRLIRAGAWISRRSTALSRFAENVTFGLTSSLRTLPLRPDVVYSNTWPIFATGMLQAVCRLRGVPVVISVQDIHPEAAAQLGKLRRDGLATRLLKQLDRTIVHRAAGVVTISQSFVDFYREVRGVPADRLHLVPNWLDEEEIVPEPRAGWFRQRLGIPPEAFVVMYAGSVGSVAGVELLIEAAGLLRHRSNLVVVVAGNGNAREACERLSREMKLNNVRFFYPWARHETSGVQAAADLFVLPTRGAGALTSVPSKLIGYMLSGRPVLAAVDPASDSAQTIRKAACGVCIPPDSPAAMAAAIEALMQQPERLEEMGENARRYAVQHFSRRVGVERLIGILEGAAQQNGRARPGRRGPQPPGASAAHPQGNSLP